MPKSLLRKTMYGAGVLAGLVLVAVVSVYALSESRLRKDYAIRVAPAEPDPALIAEGARLARSRGCADCHGDDFGGKVLLDEMPFGRIVGDNLTVMPAGHARVSVRERMYRALHHGVDLDSRPLMMMPSKEYASLSMREIDALSAYFATLAPVRRELPDSALGPVGRTLLVAGKMESFLSAESIDHAASAVAEAPPIGTLEYGRHAAQLCTGCHRGDFAGGRMDHGGPGMPPAANLTRHATGLAAWSERDFIAAMRTGRRPDGSEIDGKAMPWRAVGQASDAELHSIWLFLRSLPPIARDAAKAP
ncbi:c-type cytochrome [Luteimonas sp. SX5]|uniref:C-type cytochrome n=1 Tax=Luteimonas galliterrae TaxID=2940486 RepID=A0ABT0MJZ3_9GAMM|nr:c-type cytochrome [Luteimonas galliterrae]MCL1635178.1 c-type cytochrome [Luteimonas galliterrae]